MKNMTTKLIKDTRGANFVEYIIIVGVVALFCIAAFTAFGDNVTTKVTGQGTAVTAIRGN